MIDWPPGARIFVESGRVARLASADRSGIPHVVPICYALVGDRLYSIVDQKPKRRPTALKRLRNIADNPSVAVVVDRWDENWTHLAWVMLQGTAALVGSDAEYTAGVAALRAKYDQYAAVAFARATHPLIAVAPRKVIAWSASK